jgi:hypothetical protein
MRWYVLVSAVCITACASPRMIDTGAVATLAAESLPASTSTGLSRYDVRALPLGAYESAYLFSGFDRGR